MPEGKQRPPNALHEAAIWYLRSMAKHLPSSERDELASWLRQSPEHASAFYLISRVVRRARPRRASAHHTLSQSYYKHVKRQYLYPKIGLLAIALCGVAGGMFLGEARLWQVGAFAFACWGALKLREWVVSYRIEKGYFGSMESEVRDFIEFIATHRRDIDFTGQGGRRRPALVPESSQSASAAPAAPASNGALSE